MPIKRTTPEEDIDRLAQNLIDNYPDADKDAETFNRAFSDYLEDDIHHTSVNVRLREKVARHMGISESLFKKAKGKDFEKDVSKTAKTIVKTKKQYIKKGASKVDLKGYDTKKEQFNRLGYVKKRIVYGRPTYVIIKKHKIKRFRDRKGRFVRLRK